MTTGPRPFRFGVSAFTAPSGRAWRDLATRIEDRGYASLVVPDHANPQLAPVAALTAAATSTLTLRLGTQVLNNDIRNPVVVAKEIASLDVLSGGRAEWGMGAGWLPIDYEATGIAFDRASTRVERLDESITLIRALLGGGPVAHDGRHYRVSGIKGTPAPIQKPHPPLLIGAAHSRLLSLAGREADIVSISPAFTSRRMGPYPAAVDVETSMDHQIQLVRTAAGERASAIELSVTAFPASVTDDPDGVAERAAPGTGLTTDQVLRSPHVLVGSVPSIAETLQARRERWGISYIVIPAGAAEAFAPVVARLTGT